MTPNQILSKAFAPILRESPEVAVQAAKIVARAVDMVAKSGKITSPNVWVRAMIAASSEFASERLAQRWKRL